LFEIADCAGLGGRSALPERTVMMLESRHVRVPVSAMQSLALMLTKSQSGQRPLDFSS
jgi:hypothetical protein